MSAGTPADALLLALDHELIAVLSVAAPEDGDAGFVLHDAVPLGRSTGTAIDTIVSVAVSVFLCYNHCKCEGYGGNHRRKAYRLVNKMKKLRLLGVFLILLMGFMTACSGSVYEPSTQQSQDIQLVESPRENEANDKLPIYGENCYDLANVVLYLEAYHELPMNYMTKAEARELGWEGGSVENYRKGAAIGGDYFGNREGLLPATEGRSYTECDIDTNGYGSRGSKRLVFSNDGLYFYTSDHYESFSEVTITEDYEVIW